MTYYENAGTRLRKARLACGFKTAKAFCQAHGIPTSTYSLHETNKRCLKPQLAEKYATLLGVNVAWLLTGLGSCCPPKESLDNQKILSAEELKKQLQQNQKDPITDIIEQNFSTNCSINLLLFTKLVIKIMKMLEETEENWDLYHICQQATEIYQDVIESSDQVEEQLKMVNFAIKNLKRNTNKNKINLS
ncbi:helix-turn-helix domain-containing protein [Thiotrichales bacterium 19S11-10]|nr:helix-turn-helix domain-containing protein [Thiotrichales bacterium 19S11-10]MCF6807032.1 helix-turn-helix domain-containing protein [Thiotrichales bacterium 19S9-11]MCF6811001.1 helix-turn-helix domain-containing protein [Thiotrichales bacterium 19S9-12]